MKKKSLKNQTFRRLKGLTVSNKNIFVSSGDVIDQLVAELTTHWQVIRHQNYR